MISRSAGRSATGAAAYRSGELIHDARTGLDFDYRARSGVEHVEILAPAHAPEWVHDRAELWNRVEAAETRKNSQLAREIRVALPAELSHAQRVELVRDFCQRSFVDRGMVADIALHAPGLTGDERNHHTHINAARVCISGHFVPCSLAALGSVWQPLDERGIAEWRAASTSRLPKLRPA